MHIGIIKVVSKINKMEIPSIPNLKVIKLLIQFFSSTNWKSEVVGSNKNQRKIERKRFAIDENIARNQAALNLNTAKQKKVKTRNPLGNRTSRRELAVH